LFLLEKERFYIFSLIIPAKSLLVNRKRGKNSFIFAFYFSVFPKFRIKTILISKFEHRRKERAWKMAKNSLKEEEKAKNFSKK
jgi:hypothetical protein